MNKEPGEKCAVVQQVKDTRLGREHALVVVGLVEADLAAVALLPASRSAMRNILYYTILYYTILYYAILYHTIRYYSILYYSYTVS